MYSTRLHVYTRASITDDLASARVGRVGGQVGDDCRACPARGKLNGHADYMSGEDVGVGVGVGPMEFKH